MNDFGFRLRSLKISGHPVLKDVQFIICDDNYSYENVYVSGIIGANGTGKSHLMATIATIFSEINKAKSNGNWGARRFTFDVEYDLYNDHYQIYNKRKVGDSDITDKQIHHHYIISYKNGSRIDLEDVFLPDKVIVSTMTVADKFIARSDDFYKYRGIRNEHAVNVTGTRTLIRKTVSAIMDCMEAKAAFQSEMRILLDNLGLEKHLYIKYRLRYKDLFLHQDITVNKIKDIFDNWRSYFPGRSHAPWGYNNFLKIRDDNDKLDCVVAFLIKHALKGDGRYIASYDVVESPYEFRSDAEAIRILTQLDLISFPSVEVVKRGASYSLENSSSGETHILCQFIGIMAEIRPDSLILIDEPENSSHPNWQMNYVGWIRDIFKDYHNCHFVIATHSPLLLANLKSSESTIIRLTRNADGQIVSEGDYMAGCFSWTIDEILRDVMGIIKLHPDEYNIALNDFENALSRNSRKDANEAYSRLEKMIHPNNVLLELLKIQMIGVDDD